MQKKILKPSSKFEFDHFMQTDGVGVSFIFRSRELPPKKYGEHLAKLEPPKIPYLRDILLNYDEDGDERFSEDNANILNYLLNSCNIVACDPGMKNLHYYGDMYENYLRYF